MSVGVRNMLYICVSRRLKTAKSMVGQNLRQGLDSGWVFNGWRKQVLWMDDLI